MLEQCPVSCKDDNCKDLHVRCPDWAKIKDECNDNPDMRKYCRKSCNTCDEEPEATEVDEDGEIEIPCVDQNEGCQAWAAIGSSRHTAKELNLYTKPYPYHFVISRRMVCFHTKRNILWFQ